MEFDFERSHDTDESRDVICRFGDNKDCFCFVSQALIMDHNIVYNSRLPINYKLGEEIVDFGFWYIGSEIMTERSIITTREWQSINCDFHNPYRDVLLGNNNNLEWFSTRVQKLVDTLMDKSTLIKTAMLQDVIISEEFLQQLSSRYYIQYTPQFIRQLSKTDSFEVGSLILLNKSCHILHDLAVELVIDPVGYVVFNEHGFDEIALYSATIAKSKINSVINYSGTVYGSAHSSPASRQNSYERLLGYLSSKKQENCIVNISGDQNTYNKVDTSGGFGIKEFLPELLRWNNTDEVRIRIKQAEFDYLFYNCPMKNSKPAPTFVGISKDCITSLKDRIFRFAFSGEVFGKKTNFTLLGIRFSLDANISNIKQEIGTIEYEFTDHLSVYN